MKLGFLMSYVPPTKWYKREYALHVKIVLWPKFIARWLCNHEAAIRAFNAIAGSQVVSQGDKVRDVEQALDGMVHQDLSIPCPDCGMLVQREKNGEIVLAFHR